MKKIILIGLIILLVFIIYKTNENNLIDYMSIGDSTNLGINSYGNKTYGYNDYLKIYLKNNNELHRYNNYFSKANYKIEDLINDIKNNKNIVYDDKTYNIKHELREADLVTISIGMDEIIDILNQNKEVSISNVKKNLDIVIQNMDRLIQEIILLSKSKIILIGYYNPFNTYNKDIDNVFAYISDNYLTIAKKYNIQYVDIYNIIQKDKTYLPNKLDYHLTSRGYLNITREIISKSNL